MSQREVAVPQAALHPGRPPPTGEGRAAQTDSNERGRDSCGNTERNRHSTSIHIAGTMLEAQKEKVIVEKSQILLVESSEFPQCG